MKKDFWIILIAVPLSIWIGTLFTYGVEFSSSDQKTIINNCLQPQTFKLTYNSIPYSNVTRLDTLNSNLIYVWNNVCCCEQSIRI